MSFPTDDAYWVATAEFVEKHIRPEDRIIGPAEFGERIAGGVPATQWLLEPLDAFQWVIVPKGQLDLFDADSLKAVAAKLHAAFANEVFVVLTSHDHLPALDRRDIHMTTFEQRLQMLRADEPRISARWQSGQPWYWFSRVDGEPRWVAKRPLAIGLPDNRVDLEAFALQRCQAVSFGQDSVLCRVLGRYMVYVDAADVTLAPHLAMNGYWESWTALALARVARPGACCIDVGANYGYFTLLLADAVGVGGRVLSVEPNPHLAEILTRNIDLNGFSGRVEVVQKAVTSESGDRRRLVIPRGRVGDGNLYLEPGPHDEALEVDTATLDDLTVGWPRVDIVKIDAEGAEPDIWRGMKMTLHRNPGATVIMEHLCSRHPDPAGFIDEIEGAGFPLRYVGYDGSVYDVSRQDLLAAPDELRMLFLRR